MRLDIALVKKKLVDSREKAKYLIKEGYVEVDGQIVTKPSKDINENSKIVLLKHFEFVGKGGYKLDIAAKRFNIDFRDKIVADLGCSVGGFTDYALKHGAKRIYAIDIGDPLHKDLRKNSRVIYLPNTDARKVNLDEKVDLCLIDVTFSSIKELLPIVKKWLKDDGEVLGLIKPPFEIVNKSKTKKRIKKIDYKKCLEVVEDISNWASVNGYSVEGITPIKPSKKTKQQEFFIYLRNKN